MKCENYELVIPDGKYKGGGYVVLNHKQQYVIKLINNNVLRCSAEVCVDGKPMGTWIINGGSEITLERPANDTGKFTFYKNGTKEFHKTLADVQKSDRGLITVTFKQELIRFTWPQNNGLIWPRRDCFTGQPIGSLFSSSGGSSMSTHINYCSSNSSTFGFSSGGTGLSGESSQEFGTTYFEANDATAVTMSVRLVGKSRRYKAEKDEPRKLQPVTHNTYPMPV